MHFEERANRFLLLVRMLLSPFVIFFVTASAVAAAVVSLIYAFLFFLNRHRNSVAFGVPALACNQIGAWSSFLLLLSDRWPPKSSHIHIAYSPLASRFEIFFRPMFFVMLAFNWIVFSVPSVLFLIFQAFSILLFGRRNVALHILLSAYWRFMVQSCAYIFQATDERPLILPSEFTPAYWFARKGGVMA